MMQREIYNQEYVGAKEMKRLLIILISFLFKYKNNRNNRLRKRRQFMEKCSIDAYKLLNYYFSY